MTMGAIATLLWKGLLIKRRSWVNALLEATIPVLIFLAITIALSKEMQWSWNEFGVDWIQQDHNLNKAAKFNAFDTSNMTDVRFAFVGSEETYRELRQIIGDTGQQPFLVMFSTEQALRDALYWHSSKFWQGVIEHKSGHNSHFSYISTIETTIGPTSRMPWNIFNRGNIMTTAFFNASPFLLIEGLRVLSLHRSGAVRFNPEGRFPTMDEASSALIVSVASFPTLGITIQETIIKATVLICSALFLGFAFIYIRSLASLVNEKETRVAELTRTMGATRFEIVAAWWLVQVGMAVVSSILVAVAATVATLNHVSPLIILTLYLVTSCFFVTVAIALSPLFTSVRAAQLIGAVFFLIVFVCAYFSSLEAPPGVIKALCLIPGVGFFLGARIVLDFASINEYFPLRHLSTQVFNTSLATVMGFTLIGFVCVTIAGLYLNLVVPSSIDAPLPWHFPVSVPYRNLRNFISPKATALNSSALKGEYLALQDENDFTSVVVSSSLAADDVRANTVDALFAASPRVHPGAYVETRSLAPDADVNDSALFSTAPVMQLRSLRREFRAGAPAAVRSLDLDIHRGELVALLGRSGAGKSTVLAMVTGALAPTSGWIRVCGQDVTAGGGARAGLVGVCPQDNTLYNGLTVSDHLDFCARLKGINDPNARKQAIIKWSDRVGLGPMGDNKLDSIVKVLSGGQKRKLCLAMAFIGDPQLVILDEPTAGLDVSAQRSVRELLHAERQARAILISTHSMEEAEACDRVVILAEGSLQCSGSPAFLKHQFGAGYTLTVAKIVDKKHVSKAVDAFEGDDEDEDEDEDEERKGSVPAMITHEDMSDDDAAVFTTDSGRNIFFYLRSIISGLRPTRDVVGDVCFSVPAASSSSLPTALLALDAAPAALAAGSYTVAVTSLDGVFRRVTEDACVIDDANRVSPFDGRYPARATPARTEALGRASTRARSSEWVEAQDPLLIPHQLLRRDSPSQGQTGKLLNDMAYSSSDDIALRTVGNKDESQWGPDYEARRLYPGVPFTKILWALYSKHARAATRETLSMRWQVLAPMLIIFGSSLISWGIQQTETRFVPMSMELFPAPRFIDMPIFPGESAAFAAYRDDMIDAFPTAQFGTRVDSPVVDVDINACSNPTNIEKFFSRWQMHQSREHFRSFSLATCDIRGFPPIDSSNETTVISTLLFVNTTANHAWPVAHVAMANAWMQAAHKAQGKPGPPPTLRIDHRDIAEYSWSTPLKVTSLMVTVYGIVIAGLIFLSGAAVVRERALGSMHLQFISGAPRGAYWLSHMLWELTLSLTHLLAFFICAVIFDMRSILGPDVWFVGPAYIAFVLALLPLSYFASYLASKPEYAQTIFLLANSAVILIISTLVVLPIADGELFVPFITFFSGVIPTLAFIMFLPWVFFQDYRMPMSIYDYDDFTPMYVLGVSIALTWTLLFIFEADSLRNIRARVQRFISRAVFNEKSSDTKLKDSIDPDVAREEELIFSGGCENAFSFPLVLKGLRKVYPSRAGSFIAVSNLSFAVSRGQCFGFLGANGAGKSTTMRMLTGDERPTAGEAHVNGFDTERDRTVASMLTGYCPQLDAFFPYLTPRENLRFFAVLRGVSDGNIARHVGELLTRTGLAENHADVVAAYLSVGNKRKLSVAIALIGNPPVVILDEPTAGIDPCARHDIWNLVSSTMVNRSVILTTHSMDECEALCDRIGIMAGGVMRCIGVPSFVKSAHGSGYSCSISLANVACAPQIDNYLSGMLPRARCISRNGNAMSFHVPPTLGKSLADVFSALDAGRKHGIVAYSACSADLGDAFLKVVPPSDAN